MTIDELRAEFKAHQENEARLEERARLLSQQAREAQREYDQYTVSNRVSALRMLQWSLETLGVEL